MAAVLVIGYGYLGSCLAGMLATRGHRVASASRHGSGECLAVDLGSAESVRSLARDLGFAPEFVVHCASSSRGGEDAYRLVFEEGCRHVLESFPDSKIILTSSTSVYAQTEGETVTEDSPAVPDRETGMILRRAEDLLLERGHTVLRLAGIYGPGRSVHLARMLEGSAAIESGAVSRWLNQIHRDDAGAAIVHLIEGDATNLGKIYNVADDEPLTQRACYEGLARLLNRPIPGEAPPDLTRKRAWTNKRVDNTRLKAAGWRPKYPTFLRAVAEDSRFLLADGP